MLRSVVRWFQTFLRLCRGHFKWVIRPEDMDYEAMRHILRSQSKHKVHSFPNRYNETAFADLIQSILQLAQFLADLRGPGVIAPFLQRGWVCHLTVTQALPSELSSIKPRSLYSWEQDNSYDPNEDLLEQFVVNMGPGITHSQGKHVTCRDRFPRQG